MDKNISLTYLVPLFLKPFSINKKGIINSYLYHIDYPDYNIKKIEGLFIVFSYSYVGKQDFRNYKTCEEIIDIDEDHFVVFFKQDDFSIIKDIDLIMKSKYSKISELSKKNIVNFWALRSDHKVVSILTKSIKYKEMLEESLDCILEDTAELGNYFDVSKEVFDNKSFNKNIIKI